MKTLISLRLLQECVSTSDVTWLGMGYFRIGLNCEMESYAGR
jgi:hypothetical protein